MNMAVEEGMNQFERIMDMLGIGSGRKDGVEKSYEVCADNLGDIFRLKCVNTITKSSGERKTVVLLANGDIAHIGDTIVKLKNDKWEVRHGI